MSLVAKNVCKYIRGIPILENINLEMNNGIIYGLWEEMVPEKQCFSGRCPV